MKYLVVDGMFSGTGIRDSVEGGYIELADLNISETLQTRINSWLEEYEDAHFSQYKDEEEIGKLDAEGINILKMLREEIPDSKIEYYSNAKMEKIAD